jgi:hypothetical protein
MIPIPVIWSTLKAVPWRAILWATLVAGVALAGWRVSAWKDSHERLGEVEAELAREVACEPLTACSHRAEEQARLARERAEEAAQSALESAQEAEAKARADASAWRAKYRAAVQTDPDCSAWNSQPIRCPL